MDLCPQRITGRATANALRAAGINLEKSYLRPAMQPGAHGVDTPAGQPVSPAVWRSALSVPANHLPADGASHGGRHVALAPLVIRVAAGGLLRGLAGTRRGNRTE